MESITEETNEGSSKALTSKSASSKVSSRKSASSKALTTILSSSKIAAPLTVKFSKVNPVTNKFVSFGCWNQLQTDDGVSIKNTQVMATLKKRKVDMVLVSGDNYYPVKKKDEKGKKKKTIILEDLINGFNNLKIATKSVTPVFMNFGNHDVVQNEGMKIIKNGEENTNPQECTILNEEMHQATDNIHLKMSHHILYGDHTLVLMIDTTIYGPENEFANEFNKCYQQITGYDGNLQKRLQAEQHDFVENALLNFKGQYIIMVGHYPIIYKKLKKEKMVNKIESSIEFTDLLMLLPSDKTLTYLCADYHLYEEGMVRINGKGKMVEIHQYIIGTGGTSLNNFLQKESTLTQIQKRNKTNELAEYNFDYQLLNTEHSHGFIEAEYNKRKDAWGFKFVHIASRLERGSRYNNLNRFSKSVRSKTVRNLNKKRPNSKLVSFIKQYTQKNNK
jgi:hypothetical protein